jgi:hypothetical protein
MHTGHPPSRIRQSWADDETKKEHWAARADNTGVDLPIISLSQIRRLDVGIIRLSDVVSYAQPGGAVAERQAGEAVDHIQVAHHDTPASQGGPSENGLFRRRGPDNASRRRTARPRRSVSVPLVERPVKSAYLSTVPARIDPLLRSTGRATPPSALDAGTSQAELRQERVDTHNAWLLRKEGERGNTWKILELLQAGVPTCSADEEGRTACHLAAMNNHSKVGCTVVVRVHGWMHASCTRACVYETMPRHFCVCMQAIQFYTRDGAFSFRPSSPWQILIRAPTFHTTSKILQETALLRSQA